MSRAAVGFFLLHTDILLSLDGLIEVKTTVDQLCENLSPSAARAITHGQGQLAGPVAADSVVEALRARARRQVNLQRRETARDRSRAHSWKHVEGGVSRALSKHPSAVDDEASSVATGSTATGMVDHLHLYDGISEEEAEGLLEYFVAEDAAGFHSFLQNPAYFLPSRLDWAHFHLILGEAGIPPPAADAATLFHDFVQTGRLGESESFLLHCICMPAIDRSFLLHCICMPAIDRSFVTQSSRRTPPRTWRTPLYRIVQEVWRTPLYRIVQEVWRTPSTRA